MHNKFIKNFLKTTALATAIFATASNLQAATLIDETGADVEAGTKAMTATKFASLVPGGTLAPVSTALTMARKGSEAHVMSATGAAVTLTAFTAAPDSHLYLYGPAADTVIITALTGPSSGIASIHLKRSTVTFTANPDNTFKIIGEYSPLVSGTTVTGAAADFPAAVEAVSPLTFATVTSLSGAITGESNIHLGAAITAVTGDTSKFKGNFVTGAALTDVALPPVGGIEVAGAHDLTVTSTAASTLGRLYVNGNCTFTPTANVTIKELYLYSAGSTITFAPPAGVRITVSKIMPGSDGNIQLNGDAAGRLKIASGSTSGALAIVSGIVE